MFFSLLSGPVSRAAAPDSSSLIPSDLGISIWDESFHLRGGIGYNDNVLLDDANRKSSGFFDSGVDALILRLPLDEWEVHFLLTGDDIRYWRDIVVEDVRVDHEDLWLASAEAQREFGDGWKAGALAQFGYENQVVDLFTYGIPAPPTKIEGETFMLKPVVQKTLITNLWLRLEIEGTRQFLSQPAVSFFRVGPRLALGWDFASQSSLSLSYGAHEILYDHAFGANGAVYPINGGSLRALRKDTVLEAHHFWDARRSWESTANISFGHYGDNASGYLNYYEYGASAQLRFSAKSWLIKGSASVVYNGFPSQTITVNPDLISPASPLLHKTLLISGVRVERSITKYLKLFANYESQVSLSDSPDEVYHANTVTGGLDWEF